MNPRARCARLLIIEMPYLSAVEIKSAATPQASIIWLHGLGADGNDFVPIVRELNLSGAPGIRFIVPHAPMQPVTMNGGYLMHAWYDRQPGSRPRPGRSRGALNANTPLSGPR